MYIPSKPFTCLDGSLTVPFEFVNDDYCDCQDGSDEPGTSACSNGQFFCENKGYLGTLIPSHFVGDGICDCCDGSDEYETTIVCNNTCFASNSSSRSLILNLTNNLNFYQSMFISIFSTKNKKSFNLKKSKYQTAKITANATKIFSQHGLLIDRYLDKTMSDENYTNNLFSILGSDSVNFNEFNTIVFEKISNSYQSSPEPTTPTPEPTPLPEPSIYSATTPSSILETHGYEEEEVTTTSSFYKDNEEENNNERDDYHESSSVSTSLEHEKHIHASLAPEYDNETKVLIQIADQARNEYNQLKEKIIQIKRQIQDFKKQSDVDLGPNSDYAPILDECFDYDEREYTYRICMFKTAKQISKGGSSEVTIGYWDSWSGPKDDKYLKMKYSNGATCWNGPPRSLTVTLQCGTEQKLSDVREPSRCEYTMTFETPLACDETIANRPLHPGHVEF
ncbi:unnamed protein product [Rotaria socialis]|uniref:Glucosidase 2 subunit beta n=1 Tax=Rotaria socialis TaxID=392032 RepID=A0A821UQT0_9BILA|nr:unnamed protein product [Rotaria socialis]